MLVSIIIPIYNAESFLDQCLRSIQKQSYPNLEVILVNDGSTDRSKSICDQYVQMDQRFRVIHKPNGGVSSARNIGLDHAKGDKIVFIDADDYVNESYIEDLMHYCDNDLVVMGVAYINSARTLAPRTKKIILDSNSELLETLMFNNYFTAPWAKLFSASIINKHRVRFNENLFIGEDTVFILEYLQYTNTIQCISLNGYMFYDVMHQELSKYALSCKEYAMLTSIFSKCIEKLQKKRQISLLHFQQHLLVYYGKLFFTYLLNTPNAEQLKAEITYYKQKKIIYVPDSNKKEWAFRCMTILPYMSYNILKWLRNNRK